MRLTDEEIKELGTSVRRKSIDVYKGGYTFTRESMGVVNFLRRNGVAVDVDDHTGKITIERRPDADV